jgi:hypothetical protein
MAPVAPPARPLSARVELVPYGALNGVALAVNDDEAWVTVSVVVAVDPEYWLSPE